MIEAVYSSSYDSNCYIIAGKKTAVVDAGANPMAVLRKVEELGVGVDYLINTHCHFDHTGGDFLVVNRTGAKLCVHESGVRTLESGDSAGALADWFGGSLPKLKVDVRLKDGQRLDLEGVVLEIVHTPGHSPEGVCLYEPKTKSLFSGDTVFSDGVGRTDLAGGSMKELKESLEKLVKLHRTRGVAAMYPGHGPPGDGEDILSAYETYF